MSGTFEKKRSIRNRRKDALRFGFLDPMITPDCLIQMNKNVEH